MKVWMRASAVWVLCVLGAVTAHAGTVTFNFSGLPNGGSDATVQTALQTQLTSQSSGAGITVTGAASTSTWNGDGHVNGNTLAVHTATVTGGTFLVNNQGAVGAPSTDPQLGYIRMVFTGLNISTVSFNLEIFPDASCPSSPCSPLPDFTFQAGSSVATLAPVTGGSWSAQIPTSGDPAPQLGPTGSGIFTLAAGTTVLEFDDWPATIGISDLKFTTPTSPTPEPSSMLLFGTGLSGTAFWLRRRTKQQVS
jgi:hypothetical protein